jgi:hypothetical protein
MSDNASVWLNPEGRKLAAGGCNVLDNEDPGLDMHYMVPVEPFSPHDTTHRQYNGHPSFAHTRGCSWRGSEQQERNVAPFSNFCAPLDRGTRLLIPPISRPSFDRLSYSGSEASQQETEPNGISLGSDCCDSTVEKDFIAACGRVAAAEAHAAQIAWPDRSEPTWLPPGIGLHQTRSAAVWTPNEFKPLHQTPVAPPRSAATHHAARRSPPGSSRKRYAGVDAEDSESALEEFSLGSGVPSVSGIRHAQKRSRGSD